MASLPFNDCPTSTTLNGQPAVDLSGLTADQQFQAGLFCGSQHATPFTRAADALPRPRNMGRRWCSIPAPNTQNDDHNPQRVAPRNLFDLAIGVDDLFNGDSYKWSLQLNGDQPDEQLCALQLPVDLQRHALRHAAQPSRRRSDFTFREERGGDASFLGCVIPSEVRSRSMCPRFASVFWTLTWAVIPGSPKDGEPGAQGGVDASLLGCVMPSEVRLRSNRTQSRDLLFAECEQENQTVIPSAGSLLLAAGAEGSAVRRPCRRGRRTADPSAPLRSGRDDNCLEKL